LVDLDGDGRTDVLSGSWPGEIYFFRRNPDGKTFAAGETLKGRDGKPVRAGSASAAFAADWDGSGRPGLLVGNVLGEVYFLPNEGKGRELVFGTPRRLEAAGQPIKVDGDAAPVVADWDGDGRPDLIVGASDGSVVWYRNAGGAGLPRLEAARTLVGASPLGWGGDDLRCAGDWGVRVKPCVVDWNGTGRPDLLLGDRCGGYRARPRQTAGERAEEQKADDQLPALRFAWAAAFRRYRQIEDPPGGENADARREWLRERDALREELRRTKDEIAAVEAIQGRYEGALQTHGFVWLFRRAPTNVHPPSPKGP
jgi:hypothetical protein